MKKISKKYGMTIAEVMIVLVIIGFIATLTIASAKPFDKALKKLYARAYDALNTATYNTTVDLDSNLIDTPENLCKGLAKYINSKEATAPKSGEEFDGTSNTGYCNDVATRITNTTEDVNGLTPDFVANNGMKFYISTMFSTANITDSDSISAKINYYLVYVDLDGDKGAGLIGKANNKRTPDVVAFAITNTGEVLPLGQPTIDKTYLNVRVVYPEADTNVEKLSKPLTYYEAQHMAWGNNTSHDDYRTFNMTSYLNNNSPIKKYMSAYPAPPDQDTANDCIDFDCDIRIQRYF